MTIECDNCHRQSRTIHRDHGRFLCNFCFRKEQKIGNKIPLIGNTLFNEPLLVRTTLSFSFTYNQYEYIKFKCHELNIKQNQYLRALLEKDYQKWKEKHEKV